MRMHAFILAAALAFGGPALAHEAANGPHGGRVVDAGEYHVELVQTGTGLELFVTDGKDHPAPAGFKGTAIVLIDGKSQRVALESAGPGRLRGTMAAPPAAAAIKAVVQLTTPDGKPVTARFQ